MPTVSVILPVYNATRHLPLVLPPLTDALADGKLLEVIAIDDCSTDGSAQVLRDAGLRVFTSAQNSGPAACRNIGAEAARGDVLLFIDSDVVMHADVPTLILEALAEPDCVAVFGSYDDRPRAKGLVSQYRNLLHHFTHQRGEKEASTFWAGCGAVERQAFLAVDGFDAQRYPRPTIEDIELGYRLRKAGGRIALRRDIQGTHLKHWTLGNMLVTDIFCSAVPWSRLLLNRKDEKEHLNITIVERLKAVIAGLFWLSLLVSLLRPAALVGTLALLVLAWLVNASFFRLILRQNGLVHMLAAVLLHQLYYLYSTVTYIWCLAEHQLGIGRSAATSG